MSRSPGQGPVRVGLYGFFGMGNLGNEGSLTAFLEQARQIYPGAQFLCFGADGATVAREHSIAACQLMSYRGRPDVRGFGVLVLKGLSRLWDIPRTYRLMGKIDALVVPGTGVLESRLMSTPWGLPYWLLVAVVSCRLRRRKVALVSIGAEPATRAATRWFMCQIVRLADYVSYRDAPSAAAARSMGAEGRPGTVYSDLAFSMAPAFRDTVVPGRIAIGVMTFLGGADDLNRGEPVVERYVASMVRLVARLCERGDSVTLLLGDQGDRDLALRIERRVRAAQSDLDSSTLSTQDVRSFEEVMRCMAAAEVVVASRFHNIIGALNVGRPTVSLGYAVKNDHLLEMFGLGAYCQPMDAFDVDRAISDIDDAKRNAQQIQSEIARTVQSFRQGLASQMNDLSHLFEPNLASNRRYRKSCSQQYGRNRRWHLSAKATGRHWLKRLHSATDHPRRP